MIACGVSTTKEDFQSSSSACKIYKKPHMFQDNSISQEVPLVLKKSQNNIRNILSLDQQISKQDKELFLERFIRDQRTFSHTNIIKLMNQKCSIHDKKVILLFLVGVFTRNTQEFKNVVNLVDDHKNFKISFNQLIKSFYFNLDPAPVKLPIHIKPDIRAPMNEKNKASDFYSTKNTVDMKFIDRPTNRMSEVDNLFLEKNIKKTPLPEIQIDRTLDFKKNTCYCLGKICLNMFDCPTKNCEKAFVFYESRTKQESSNLVVRKRESEDSLNILRKRAKKDSPEQKKIKLFHIEKIQKRS
jgi:hypothetical protein